MGWKTVRGAEVRRLLVCLGGLATTSCAAPVTEGPFAATGFLAYDDGRSDSEIALPDGDHESLVRFPLANGTRLRRIWWRQRGTGRIRITIYASTPFEGPGKVLGAAERDATASADGCGPDNRETSSGKIFLFEDLADVTSDSDAVWIGFRRVAGEVGLCASDKDAREYFIRRHHADRVEGLLPVRRTPIVRLEFVPPS